jgi:lipopolysaccharide transport system ATP-binding protein
MQPVITVENLGKQYRLGSQAAAYATIRETVSNAFRGRRRSEGENGGSPKTIWALRDVNFTIKPGEVVGIIGRNGAGKSTLLKILSRITEPTTGRVELRGRVGSLLEVGTGFHPELTGGENIYLNGAILGMSRVEIARKFDDIIDFAEIGKFIDTPVKRYSSGMYIRLAFAVAAHLEPEILLVDEVLAVGDAEFQKKCLGKLNAVAGQGRTVIFISHNMAAIHALCQRAILLDRGQIVSEGSVPQVVTDYLQAGISRLGERVWRQGSMPGDEIVRLRAVRALNLDGEVSNEFKVTDTLSVEVEFAILRPGHTLHVGLYFYDQSGNLLFFVSDFQDKKWINEPRSPGNYYSTCEVPAELLNEGQVTVTAAIASLSHTHVVERDAISFQLNEDYEARTYYKGPWPGGMIRPRLNWSFRRELIAQGADFSGCDAEPTK